MEKKRQKYLASLMFVTIVSMIPVIGSHEVAGKYYYVSLLVAGVMFLPILFLILRVSDLAGDHKNIFAYLMSKNKFLGKGFSLLFAIYGLVSAITSLRTVGEGIKLTALFNTPMIVVFIGIMILSFAFVKNGFRSVGQFASLFAPVMVIGIILCVILSVGRYESENLVSLSGIIPKKLYQSALESVMGVFGDAILILFISGMRNDGEKTEPLRKRYFLLSYAAAFFCIMISVINSTLVLGGDVVNKLYFPHYISASLINLGFVSRLEIILDVLYFISSTVKVAFSLYCSVKGLECFFCKNNNESEKPSRKAYIILFFACVLFSAFAFDTTQFFFHYLHMYRKYSPVALIILIVLWIVTETLVRRGRINVSVSDKL